LDGNGFLLNAFSPNETNYCSYPSKYLKVIHHPDKQPFIIMFMTLHIHITLITKRCKIMTNYPFKLQQQIIHTAHIYW